MPSMRSSLETNNPSVSSLLRLIREEFDAYKYTKEDELLILPEQEGSNKATTLINNRIDKGFEYVFFKIIFVKLLVP